MYFSIFNIFLLTLGSECFASLHNRQQSANLTEINEYLKLTQSASYAIQAIAGGTARSQCRDQTLVDRLEEQGLDGEYTQQLLCQSAIGFNIFPNIRVAFEDIVAAVAALRHRSEAPDSPPDETACRGLGLQTLYQAGIDASVVQELVCGELTQSSTLTSTQPSTFMPSASPGPINSSNDTTSLSTSTQAPSLTSTSTLLPSVSSGISISSNITTAPGPTSVVSTSTPSTSTNVGASTISSTRASTLLSSTIPSSGLTPALTSSSQPGPSSSRTPTTTISSSFKTSTLTSSSMATSSTRSASRPASTFASSTIPSSTSPSSSHSLSTALPSTRTSPPVTASTTSMTLTLTNPSHSRRPIVTTFTFRPPGASIVITVFQTIYVTVS